MLVAAIAACTQDPLAPERVTVHLRNEDVGGRDVYIMVGNDETPSPEDLITYASRVRRIQVSNDSPLSRFFRATRDPTQSAVLAICVTAGAFDRPDPGLHVVWTGSSLECQGW